MLVILLFIMIYLFNVNATNINRNPSYFNEYLDKNFVT